MSDTQIATEILEAPKREPETAVDQPKSGRLRRYRQELKELGVRGFIMEKSGRDPTKKILKESGRVAQKGEYQRLFDTTVFTRDDLAKKVAELVNKDESLVEHGGAHPYMGRLNELIDVLTKNGVDIPQGTESMPPEQQLYQLVFVSMNAVRQRMGSQIDDQSFKRDRERMTIALAQRLRLEGNREWPTQYDRQRREYRGYYDLAASIEKHARNELEILNSSS